MKIEEIAENLCDYDPRNPNRVVLDEYPPFPNPKCRCGNCYYKRTQLAEALLESLDKLKQQEEHGNVIWKDRADVMMKNAELQGKVIGLEASIAVAMPEINKLKSLNVKLTETLALAYSFMITNPEYQGRNILNTIKSALLQSKTESEKQTA